MAKPRRNPLGSIFNRRIKKHGRTITVYDVRKRVWDANAGKYRDRTKRCYSYAEAQVELANMSADIERPVANVRLADLVDYFSAEYVKPPVISSGQKISGYRQSLSTVKRYLAEISEFFGNPPLASITYEDCRRFREHLATTPTKNGTLPAASTYHKKLSILSKMLNIAVRLGWIDHSPMTRGPGLIKGSAERKRNRMLTYDEEERLVAACVPHYAEIAYSRRHKNTGKPEQLSKRYWVDRSILLPFIYCSLDAAMRRGEIYDLRWWQVDFTNRVIYLTKEAAAATKTGAEGILPLTDRLAFHLLEIRNSRNSRNIGPNDLVLGRVDFRTAWENACREAGIPDLQFRDLRATGATRMLLAGNSGDMVRKVTRHTKAETFLDHYTAVDAANARMIGQKLQEFNEKQRSRGEVRGDNKTRGTG